MEQRSRTMDVSAFDRLTERQRTCLRLVGTLANSKEIAIQLGISRHTVDEHIREAMTTLGLTSRQAAARALAAYEASTPQRLSTQPIRIETTDPDGPSLPSLGERDSPRQDTERSHELAPMIAEAPAPSSWLGLPFPTRGRPRNDLDGATRLFWIGVVLIGLILAASLFLALAVRYSHSG